MRFKVLRLYSVLKPGWAYLRLHLNEEGSEIPYSREINDKTHGSSGYQAPLEVRGTVLLWYDLVTKRLPHMHKASIHPLDERQRQLGGKGGLGGGRNREDEGRRRGEEGRRKEQRGGGKEGRRMYQIRIP